MPELFRQYGFVFLFSLMNMNLSMFMSGGITEMQNMSGIEMGSLLTPRME